MAKKFKETKFIKVASKVLSGAIDLFPGGTTVKDILKNVIGKSLDRNGDGKVTIKDFKPLELIGILVGLIVLSILASNGVIDIEILRDIAEILGF